MMIMRTALAFVVLLVLYAPVTHAGNGTIGSPAIKPISNCPPVCIPDETDPCCEPIKMTCSVTHSNFEMMGHENPTRLTQDYECAQCFSCCPCCPVLLDEGNHRGDCCNCSELPSLTCTNTISLSITESIQVSISSTLEASAGLDANYIRSQLEASHGATDGQVFSFDQACGVTVGPCAKYSNTAFLEYFPNKSVTVTHTFYIRGVWSTASGCAPQSCQIDGMPFETPGGCHTETSTATGQRYSRQSCGNDATYEQCAE